MGSELRYQNFDLAKFQEIVPRNPCYGARFYLGTLPQNSKKKTESPAELNFGKGFGLDNFLGTSPRRSCAAF